MESALGQGFGLPFPFTGGAGAINTFTLDQDADSHTVIFQAREAMTITRLGFNFRSESGTLADLKISLQGVTNAGVADGAIKGGGSPASKVFNPETLGWSNNTWQWLTLDNSYQCSRGEFLAVHVTWNSSAGGSCLMGSTFSPAANAGFPYAIRTENGTPGRQTSLPIFGYGSATKEFGNPIQDAATVSPTVSTTPDEYGVAFTVPTNFCSYYTLRGVRFLAVPNDTGNTGTMRVQLYNNTTVLASLAAFDHSFCQNTASVNGLVLLFQDATLPILTAGQEYIIGIAPQAANSLSLYTYTFASSDDMDAWPGGSGIYVKTRSNDGAWSNDTTRRLLAEVLFDSIDRPKLLLPSGYFGATAG